MTMISFKATVPSRISVTISHTGTSITPTFLVKCLVVIAFVR